MLQRLPAARGQVIKRNAMKWYLVVLAVVLFSCKKDKSCEKCNSETGFVEATVIYSGPMEADGCGWLVKVGADHYYHPRELDSDFRQNELAVRICYETTGDKFICGIGALGIPVIDILSIEK